MHQYLYAFAAGWNVPLVNLNNIEDVLGSRNRTASGVLEPISIRSAVVREYSVATVLESGRVRGDGKIPHFWDTWMFSPATTYLMSQWTTAASEKWTIYTRRHELGTYARFNVWAIRPGTLEESDLVYIREEYLFARIRFSDLVLAS